MHAILTSVEIDPERGDEAIQLLESFVVPTSKSAAGFVSGTWARSLDGRHGHGMLVFDTQANAEALAQTVAAGPPEGAPVTFRSADVLEVLAQA